GPAHPAIYSLSLHDALPILFSESQLARALIAAEDAGITPIIALNKYDLEEPFAYAWQRLEAYRSILNADGSARYPIIPLNLTSEDRKSTRLNSSHVKISYAV